MSRLTAGYLAATAVTACNSCDSWEDWQYCCWWLMATDSVYKTNVWASSTNNCWDISKLCPTWLRHVDTSYTTLSPFNYRQTHRPPLSTSQHYQPPSQSLEQPFSRWIWIRSFPLGFFLQKRTDYLWPPCIADADIIFLSCSFFFFFYLLFFFA